jgi:hypothetical protein
LYTLLSTQLIVNRSVSGYSVAGEVSRSDAMHVFNLKAEEKFDPKKHVERVLGRVAEGDVTVACWEPGQTSP